MADVRYVTVQEVAQLLGTSTEDKLIESLIIGAEALFDSLVWSDTGLLTSSKTEDHVADNPDQSYENRNRIFYLRTHKPTAITTINTVAPWTIDVDYTLTDRTLEFKTAKTTPSTFPYRFRIVYVSGYANIDAIPQDIKLAIKYMVGALYNRKNSEGISSFKQDLLSVNYDKQSGILDQILSPEDHSFVTATINRYKVPFIFST